MFEFCLAPDTSGDGTGCDNMTCIIIVFKDLLAGGATSQNTSKRKAETDADSLAGETESKRLREDEDVAT